MDTRLISFLELLETKNYTQAAKHLNITQPAVTKHIQSLEEEFGVKLFTYDGKKIHLNPAAERLASYARSQQKNYKDLVAHFKKEPLDHIKIGLTKTLGTYAYVADLGRMISTRPNDVTLLVDNTEILLDQLKRGDLDFLLVEGRFAKSEFAYRVLQEEVFTGLCPKGHPYEGQTLQVEDLLKESILIREPGSGSREILEEKLYHKGYSVKDFSRLITCSSLSLIVALIKRGTGLSFGYESILKKETELAAFGLDGVTSRHEFCLVALKGTAGLKLYDELLAGETSA